MVRQINLALGHNWYWVAGLLEGEGTFYATTSRKSRAFRIECEMTDEDVIRRLRDVTAVGTVTSRQRSTPGREHHKRVWRWKVSKREDVWYVLVNIAPQMGKRRRARIDEIMDELKGYIYGPDKH